MNNQNIAILMGTRPEIIKMSSIVRECERLDLKYFILYTGQHYSENMGKLIFETLEIPTPKFNLKIGSGSQGTQTGKMIIGIEEILKKEKPKIVLVQGDTNSTLAGAIAASKLGIEVGHVEAGLRSYDKNMPEEINRILTDHCSKYLFAPTKKSESNLLCEGILRADIHITGNTIVDVIYEKLARTNLKKTNLGSFNLNSNKYFLATIHRQENVDNKIVFSRILEALNKVSNKFGFPIVYPIHPRSRKRIQEFNISVKEIELIEPVDFLTFIHLEKNAKLIMTDSGGVQEEACILKVPCVTLRDKTERPETIDICSNVLAGTKSNKILKSVDTMLNREKKWTNPFGNGNASKRIIKILCNKQKI